ncbi:THAP-type domain-containing protein, partial [Aphis craccivora]
GPIRVVVRWLTCDQLEVVLHSKSGYIFDLRSGVPLAWQHCTMFFQIGVTVS